MRQGWLLPPLTFTTLLEVIAELLGRKINVGIQIRREEIKLSPFADDMILYLENPKESTIKTLITNKLRKVAGFKINLPKLVVFLYISNEQSEKDSQKIFLVKIA